MSASTLINRFGKAYSVRRYAAGTRVDGHWVDGAEVYLDVADQVQVITFDAVPDAGALALAFGATETAPIEVPGSLSEGTNLDDWALSLTEAFEALEGVGAGNALVSGALTEGQLVVTISFAADLGEAPQDEVTAASNSLTAAGTALNLVTSVITVPGVAPETRLTAVISLQTVSGREAVQLPEGDRTKEARKGYTTTALRTVNDQTQTKADRIEAEDRLWEVRRVDPYPSETDLPHYRVLAILVEDDTAPEE